MEPVGGDLADHDHEFDEVRWIPFDSAATMLTFETERSARREGGRPAAPAPTGRGRVVTDPVEAPVHLTPLTDAHRDLGARLIEFGGWLMPVQYGSIIDEHRTVRTTVGLFDLSHMGELYVDGPEAGPALAAALISDPPSLAVGRAHYSMICTDDGGIIDDLIVYRLGETRFLVVANAGNAAIVSDALAERLDGRPGHPRRPLARHGPAGRPGSGRGGRPRPVHRRRPVRPPLLRGDRGDGRRASRASSRGPATRARTASRSSSTPTGPRSCGTPLLPAVQAAGGGPIGLGRARHAPARGGDAALRQRARPRDQPVRGGSRPGRQARQGRATSSVARRSRRSPATVPPSGSSASSSRAAASPATAIRSGRATGGPASSPAGRSRRRSACPIAMAYVAPADAEPGTVVDIEIREARIPARVVTLPFYRRDS